jgi:proteic killer suppression protein
VWRRFRVLKSFADRATEAIWLGEQAPELPPSIQRTAYRKLRQLYAAEILADLRIPPNNKLHALKTDRAGQHAIRINDQYRLCFRWDGHDAHDVEITDYH